MYRLDFSRLKFHPPSFRQRKQASSLAPTDAMLILLPKHIQITRAVHQSSRRRSLLLPSRSVSRTNNWVAELWMNRNSAVRAKQ